MSLATKIKKRNAFFYFMNKKKKDFEAEGRSFPRGLLEISEIVSDEWTKMSDSQRSRYDYDHKLGHVEATTVQEISGPSTLPRQPVLNLSPQLKEEMKKIEENILINNIAKLVQNSKNVCDMVFILTDFNIWYIDNEGHHVPAEIAMLAFSLNDGIVDEYGTLIDPRKVPSGLSGAVLDAQDAFLFPEPPFDYDPTGRNMKALLNTIFNFIKKNSNETNPGYLYCRRENRDLVKGCLDWLVIQADICHKFEVYPFEHLLMKLSQMGKPSEDDTFATVPEINSLLNSLALSGITHFGCLHHMKYWDVIQKCSLAKLNRYAYYALKFLLPNFDIEARPCSHYSVEEMADREKDIRIAMLYGWGLSEDQYTLYDTPEERKEFLFANRLMVEARTYHCQIDIEDMPTKYVPPICRRRDSSPEFTPVSSKPEVPKSAAELPRTPKSKIKSPAVLPENGDILQQLHPDTEW